MNARKNNFDLLRLIFASAVFIYHLAALPDASPLAAYRALLAQGADLGVKGFFIISGFLVYLSYIRTNDLRRYAVKRVRRLYPAYFTVVAFAAAAALFLSIRNMQDAAHLARYLVANLAFLNFLEPSLPGLFESHPHRAVNGALWTIKIEVMFYLVVPLLAWALARARAIAGTAGLVAACLAIYAGAELWRTALEARGAAAGETFYFQLARQLPGQMSYFISGVALALFGERLLSRPALAFGLSAVLFAASLAAAAAQPLQAAGLAGIIFLAALRTPPAYDAARWGDYSYGIYIAHFPIIQTLIALGAFGASQILGMAAAIALTLFAAGLMWRFVERPFLLPTSHYRGGA